MPWRWSWSRRPSPVRTRIHLDSLLRFRVVQGQPFPDKSRLSERGAAPASHRNLLEQSQPHQAVDGASTRPCWTRRRLLFRRREMPQHRPHSFGHWSCLLHSIVSAAFHLNAPPAVALAKTLRSARLSFNDRHRALRSDRKSMEHEGLAALAAVRESSNVLQEWLSQHELARTVAKIPHTVVALVARIPAQSFPGAAIAAGTGLTALWLLVPLLAQVTPWMVLWLGGKDTEVVVSQEDGGGSVEQSSWKSFGWSTSPGRSLDRTSHAE